MNKRQKSVIKQPIHQRIHRHVKLAVLPHSANNFSPHVIRWYGIVCILLVVSIAISSTHTSRMGVLGVQANITATELLSDTNRERAKAGQPALRYDERLSSAAFFKAQDMFEHQYWAHEAPDGTTPWQWFAKAGYNYAYAGENLAKNFTTTDATVAAWMASTHHRENILNEQYTDVGFAVADGSLQGKPTTLVVALYGAPASAVAGITAPTVTATSSPMSLVSRIGLTFQTMSPAVLGSVVLLLAGAVTALIAHAYRKRLPLGLRRSWRYHHGFYKALGLSAGAVALVVLYSGGQI